MCHVTRHSALPDTSTVERARGSHKHRLKACSLLPKPSLPLCRLCWWPGGDVFQPGVGFSASLRGLVGRNTQLATVFTSKLLAKATDHQ